MTVNAKNAIALSGVSALNGISKATLSAINGQTISGGGGGGPSIGGHASNLAGAVTTISTSGVATTASGSTFVIVVLNDTGVTVSSVSDNKGNTYTQIGTTQQNFGYNGACSMYRCENGVGGSGHTATANFSSNASFPSIYFVELVGVTTASFDVTAQNNDNASPFTVTTPTLSQANEIVIAIVGTNSPDNPITYAESTGFSLIEQQTNASSSYVGYFAYKVVAATGAVTPSFTASNGTQSVVFAATFKGA